MHHLKQVSLHVAFVHSFVNPLLFVVLHKGCRCIKKQSKLFKIIQFPRVFWNKLMIVPRRATIDLLCCNFSQYSARELPVTSNTDDRSFLVKLVQKAHVCMSVECLPNSEVGSELEYELEKGLNLQGKSAVESGRSHM